jgi:hypothetical protein
LFAELHGELGGPREVTLKEKEQEEKTLVKEKEGV